MNKKVIAIALSALLAVSACAETTTTPPPKPDGEEMTAGENGQQPPEMPEGDMQPPEGMEKPDGEMGDGEQPPEMPEGDMGGGQQPSEMPQGGMGGGASQPESYTAVTTVSEDTELTGEYTSTGTDENAILVTGGTVSVKDATVTRTSSDSTGGDNSSFYGVGAAILATDGEVTVENSTITTDAAGGAGVFAYGNGVATVSDTTITTEQSTSGGIHVAGGGTLYANNCTVTTQGASSAAIRSDRGGGTMVVNGGSYTANGSGSPAVYVTADISVSDAELTATGSEALCLEGRNSVTLTNCTLTGNMPDQDGNDNTWNVIVYQSMSGDSEVGKGSFTMNGGTLVSENGGMLYTTNTESEFVLQNVTISAGEDAEYFLRCTGNSNARGWGQTGSNGADCTFTAIGQTMPGDIVYDSISNLTCYLTKGSVLSGAVVDDESCAGNGGDGIAKLYLDSESTWVVTADSKLGQLYSEGVITDAQGNTVSVVGTDGSVYVEGSSEYTVTVDTYSTTCDLSGAGTIEN